MFRVLVLLFAFVGMLLAAVNINSASVEELSSLKGIGQVKAEAIVKYREANGDFKSIDELTKVKGIGEKTVEKLKDDVSVK
jgi:competence protein ComEA